MRVQALTRLYDNISVREAGDRFDIPKSLFNPETMEELVEETAVVENPKKSKLSAEDGSDIL